jgi:hypothetical protein
VVFYCVSVCILAGCGEQTNEVEEASVSEQVSNLDELIKQAIDRQNAGAYR